MYVQQVSFKKKISFPEIQLRATCQSCPASVVIANKDVSAIEHKANYRNMLPLHRCRHKLNKFERVNAHKL